MNLSTRATILTAILILARGDPLHAVAGPALFSLPSLPDVAGDSPARAYPTLPFGPNGNCRGKTFFLYPVFKKLQLAPGEQQVVFTGLEDIRSLIVLVSDRSFVFEMHGQRYEPAVASASLPGEAYVVLEWSTLASASDAVGPGAESKLPIPTLGYPIKDERVARAAAAKPLGSAECRIVQRAGFLDASATSTSARNGSGHGMVFGSTISVEPYTKVTVIAPPQPSGHADHRPSTIWVSLFAAWAYDVDKT